MPKNKGKGGKSYKKGKKDDGHSQLSRELVFKEDGQQYARVTKMLGNGRCQCNCLDGKLRMGHIRGAMRKKVWIKVNDLVLVGLRDFQDAKADIIFKYSPEEAINLVKFGEIEAETEGKAETGEAWDDRKDIDGVVFNFESVDDI